MRRGRHAPWLLLPLLLVAPRSFAQDEPLVGAYSVVLTEGRSATRGTAVIRRSGDDLELRLELGGSALEGRASLTDGVAPVRSGSRTFALDDAGGLSDAVAGALGARSRTLAIAAGLRGTTGVLSSDGRELARLGLTRQRAALLLHETAADDEQERAFELYAERLARFYRGAGYGRADVVLASSWEVVIATIAAGEEAGYLYDRVVFIGHGGWHGPILDGATPAQVSGQRGAETFLRVVDAFRRGTTPGARVYVSACHGGGSSADEAAAGESTYRWVDDLARRTGRTVAGPSGKTSTEWTWDQVRATLEGIGPVVQETRIATGRRARTVAIGEAP